MKFKLHLKVPKFPKWLKIMLCIAAAGIAAVLFIAVHSNRVIAACSEKTYSDVEKLPVRDVALLLGAAKTARSGNPNQYFLNRV